ncbi:DUF1574 family protein [Flavobacterium sp.]|uniref:DUF1574 family protein n=1 Tax=Flavobacterium sp. TaxID=239 RepID=UPI002609C391|nr:DUF1574 family protein [Flavobacterium sp.]
MKEFIIKTIKFGIVPAIFYVLFCLFAVPKLLEAKMGPNIQQQLQFSFQKAKEREYQQLVLGNSRMFCGVNPDLFSTKTFNFSHNNDSYNQLYYKLLYVEKQGKKVNSVVLGVDYFQFGIFSDTRNYVYGDFLGTDYLKDYKPKNYKIWYYVDLLHPSKIRKLIFDDKEKHGLKENGQYIRLGTPEKEGFEKREFKIDERQLMYFNKILQYCKEKSITVYLAMPPLRDVEYKLYTKNELEQFDEIIQNAVDNKTVFFFDFSRSPDYNVNDFIDFTHLNQIAADRFSKAVNELINQTKNK